MSDPQDLDADIRLAVKHFWQQRRKQSSTQGGGIDADRGARAAVTGGKQMDGFVSLCRNRLLGIGLGEQDIHTGRRVELPGWFRAEKQWDLVITHDGELVAAVEFKSQVGPSFGNNFNNRTEEALGSATDIWAAYREGAFRASARPFLGYLMMLEDCDRTRSSVKVHEPHFATFPEFHGASYQQRYAVLIEKLVRDRLYDGACFLLSSAQALRNGDFVEPHAELTFHRFLKRLLAHAASFVKR